MTTRNESTPPAAGAIHQLPDAQWRTKLDPLAYQVLRQAGTERAFTGALLEEHRVGTFSCGGCGAELFRSDAKFESGCGWPSFYEPVSPDAVTELRDTTFGMERIEIRCRACDSHLGHVFPDAPQTPTGLRFCMNSVALSFSPDDDASASSAADAPEELR